MPEVLLALFLLAGLVVVAVPIRRLALDRRSPRIVVAYVILLGLLILAIGEARPLDRYLLPLLGIVYLAPFITLGGGLDRLLGRRPPPVKVSRAEVREIPPPSDEGPDEDGGPPDDGPPAG